MPPPSATKAGQPAPATPTAPDDEFGFGTTDPDKPEYVEGGDNTEFNLDEYGNVTAWQDMLLARLKKEIPAIAEAFGESPAAYSAWLQQIFPTMLGAVEKSISSDYLAPLNLTATPQGFEFIYGIATNWLSAKDGRLGMAFENREAWASGGGGGGGRGGGAGRPTAAQIRANFDIDQLSAQVSEIFRGTILDEAKDPRGIASAYVEAIVKNPEQKLDFQTFVENQAKATPRYASLYRNKPEGLGDAQYLMPYLNSAMQAARPKEAVNIAAGGAQLGADPAAFRSRLNRTNATVTSAPFISSMENRLTTLNRVLKG